MFPIGGLLMDIAGNLYGTTEEEGADNLGTVYELPAGSSTITLLATFDGSQGRSPISNLIMDSAGNLYGTAQAAGPGDNGTIFELAKGSSTITALASFDDVDGSLPVAGLLMDSAGNLYGTAAAGGSDDAGTIFELAKGSSSITLLSTFDFANGWDPNGGLLMDGAGNLYGTTSNGGISNDDQGTFFELAKGSNTITVLASFEGTTGHGPDFVTPVMDGSGNIYGTTQLGGASEFGNVFEVATRDIETVSAATPSLTTTAGGTVVVGSGNKLTDSATLSGGYDPTGTITFTLYAPGGTTVVNTETEAVNGDGTYATPSGYTPTQLGIYQWAVSYSGDSANNPANSPEGSEPESVTLASPTLSTTPGGSIVIGSSGKLTDSAVLSGGDNPTGTITFTLYAPGGTTVVNTETVSVSGNNTYTTPNGYTPSATGTYQWVVTYSGDANNNPFSSSSAPTNLLSLASFNGTTDGAFPEGGLIADSAGDLYGTTFGDSVFELAKGSAMITALAVLGPSNPNLQEPVGNVVMDTAGNLYGVTEAGGSSGDGTIFELPKGSNTITVLASFDGSNGELPQAGLVMDSTGNLYGTTLDGGADSLGVVFELAKGSSTITVLASFDSTNGANPQDALLLDTPAICTARLSTEEPLVTARSLN